jgi:hypothetical protein
MTTTEGETSTEPSAPPAEEENKRVSISLEEAKNIDYEDLRVVALERKGPLDPGVKKLIMLHYVQFSFDRLGYKLRTLRECNRKRGLDKFERCELEIMQKIQMNRLTGSNKNSKESCTIV